MQDQKVLVHIYDTAVFGEDADQVAYDDVLLAIEANMSEAEAEVYRRAGLEEFIGRRGALAKARRRFRELSEDEFRWLTGFYGYLIPPAEMPKHRDPGLLVAKAMAYANGTDVFDHVTIL